MESGQPGSAIVSESNLEQQQATFLTRRAAVQSHIHPGGTLSEWNVMAFMPEPIIFCICTGTQRGKP